MKVVRVKVPTDKVEAIFRTGYQARDGMVVKGGVPYNARLEQAQIAVENGSAFLVLYFTCPHGDGVDVAEPRLVATLDDIVP